MLRINLGVLPWAVPGGSSSIPSDRAQNAQNSYAAAILRILRIDSLPDSHVAAAPTSE